MDKYSIEQTIRFGILGLVGEDDGEDKAEEIFSWVDEFGDWDELIDEGVSICSTLRRELSSIPQNQIDEIASEKIFETITKRVVAKFYDASSRR